MTMYTWPSMVPNGGAELAIPAGIFVFIIGLCMTLAAA